MKVFKTLTLKQVFWKTKTFLKKLVYHFLVRSTNESALFPCKTALSKARSSHSGVLLGKGVLEICRKFTGERSCRKVISIWNFTEIALRHRCFLVNLLLIFRIPFPKNTSGRLLLKSQCYGKLNREYKMGLSQRMDFCHWLVYLFENLLRVWKPLINSLNIPNIIYYILLII